MNNTFVDLTQLSKEDREKYIQKQAEAAKPKVRVEPVLDTKAADSLRSLNRPTVKYVDTLIVSDGSNFVPTYETEDAAAADLKANIEEDVAGNRKVTLTSRTMAIIDCGFTMELPWGWEANISARSGWASRGLIVTNAPGLIDPDFRGRVKVLVANIGKEILVINHGDRIAQIKPVPVYKFRWRGEEKLSDLSQTERGNGSLGSTG